MPNPAFDEITKSFIQQLEQGVRPWHQAWISTNANVSFKLPINATTGKKYQGTNILLLWMSAEKNSYPTNEYVAFKQWAEKKEFVRKDEKGSKIIKFDVLEKENDKGETDKIPYLKVYTVFNSSQLIHIKLERSYRKNPRPYLSVSNTKMTSLKTPVLLLNMVVIKPFTAEAVIISKCHRHQVLLEPRHRPR